MAGMVKPGFFEQQYPSTTAVKGAYEADRDAQIAAGEYARAMGTSMRGKLGMGVGALVDTYQGTLGPALSGVYNFGRGLVGAENAPAAVAPVAAPKPVQQTPTVTPPSAPQAPKQSQPNQGGTAAPQPTEPTIAQNTIYKWQDAKGVTNYGNVGVPKGATALMSAGMPSPATAAQPQRSVMDIYNNESKILQSMLFNPEQQYRLAMENAQGENAAARQAIAGEYGIKERVLANEGAMATTKAVQEGENLRAKLLRESQENIARAKADTPLWKDRPVMDQYGTVVGRELYDARSGMTKDQYDVHQAIASQISDKTKSGVYTVQVNNKPIRIKWDAAKQDITSAGE